MNNDTDSWPIDNALVWPFAIPTGEQSVLSYKDLWDPYLGVPIDGDYAWDCGSGACGTMSSNVPADAALESWENLGTGQPMPGWWRENYIDGWNRALQP